MYTTTLEQQKIRQDELIREANRERLIKSLPGTQPSAARFSKTIASLLSRLSKA